MSEADVILSQTDLSELIEAVKVIERHYPGRVLRLVSRNGSEGGDTKRGAGTLPRPAGKGKSGPKGGGKNRQKVAEAATGKWLTIGQLAEATGLKKQQIHGAMLGKDGPYTLDRTRG